MSLKNCAMRVTATVVCKPDARSAIIDAGTKALTNDFFPGCVGQYGYVIGHEDVSLYKFGEYRKIMIYMAETSLMWGSSKSKVVKKRHSHIFSASQVKVFV